MAGIDEKLREIHEKLAEWVNLATYVGTHQTEFNCEGTQKCSERGVSLPRKVGLNNGNVFTVGKCSKLCSCRLNKTSVTACMCYYLASILRSIYVFFISDVYLRVKYFCCC
jgi:hypothetical protein